MGTHAPNCRFCGTKLVHEVVDLGMSPPCESFLPAEALDQAEAFHPLRVLVCHECWLVQLREYVSAEEIFGREYAYFSSYSTSWVEHARRYCVAMQERLGLGGDSLVVELASNDGYLLQHFLPMGVPVLGIEPAPNVAAKAVEKGIPTLVEFFGRELAERLVAEGRAADLVVGNNVLAQVPDVNDFVAGIARLLKPQGVATLEFPHLVATLEGNQFDQFYHEHYSYFSLISVEKIGAAHGLLLFDVEELETHGGSLRVFFRRADQAGPEVSPRVRMLRARELEAGYADLAVYRAFGEKVARTKRRLLSFLIDAKEAGKKIAGYGAPGKGNTLLNYCGIRTDFLDFLVDRNPYKHGRFTPGTHIPIFGIEKIDEAKPDYLVIMPWNLTREIVQQMRHVSRWGCRFVVAIPEVRVIEPLEFPA
ncbi:methyltransferase domain-containing protein [Benzoatithermus flavus]|uniref:Class I SAM-dependent methyltransferase n=1 Tax=Benzoatithermus flavus TaxID=3108223 RepID=A0ABU8XTI1_9PROT